MTHLLCLFLDSLFDSLVSQIPPWILLLLTRMDVGSFHNLPFPNSQNIYPLRTDLENCFPLGKDGKGFAILSNSAFWEGFQETKRQKTILDTVFEQNALMPAVRIKW